MKVLVSLVLVTFISAAYGSSLYFTAVPSSIVLPKKGHLSADELPTANKFMLGLSAEEPSTFTTTGDLFSRPKALVLVSVEGVSKLSLSSVKATYPMEGIATDLDAVSKCLKDTFNKGVEWIEASSGKISGTTIAALAKAEPPRDSKVRVAPLLGEIQSIYQIADALRKSSSQLSATSPALITIRVTGIPVASSVSYEDHKSGLEALEKAIDYLSETLSSAYGDQALVEVTAHQTPDVTASISDPRAPHHITKRQADGEFGKYVNSLRSTLNVYRFVSSDYPAMFAIIAGLVIILVIAIIFIAVGIWNMDPGKDSIIYRMTTTRMKKD